MSISREDVRRTARLAHLVLSEEEEIAMVRDLGQILDYVEALQEEAGSVSDGEAGVDPVGTFLREDVEVAGMTSDSALAQAPSVAENAFRVPPMLEGS